MHRASADSDVFHAIADPTRRALLDRLRGGGAPVAELASLFPMTRPAISKHLGVLRRAGLVREQREGQRRVYHLSPARLRMVSEWADRYRVFWQLNLESLKRHLEGKGKP